MQKHDMILLTLIPLVWYSLTLVELDYYNIPLIFNYLLMILFSVILVNVQFVFSTPMELMAKPVWVIPLFLSIQYFVSIYFGLNTAAFIVLSTIIVIFAQKNIGILSKADLKTYVFFSVLSMLAILYLNIRYPVFIVLGPLWDYVFTRSVCVEDSVCLVYASFTSSIFYTYNFMLVLYVVSFHALSLMFTQTRLRDKILVIDLIARLTYTWVIAYAA